MGSFSQCVSPNTETVTEGEKRRKIIVSNNLTFISRCFRYLICVKEKDDARKHIKLAYRHRSENWGDFFLTIPILFIWVSEKH